ncbi:hypothetical protein QTI33_15625 [Variovorax sp. J22P271]|uniref:hypothetical protein n=1 Tax=Variovorax davisae TaxID=3053515 RepID=UPI0025779664|nr:hypothetical protein [Variovorax sp. J22P271]MDM0033562.1 hypothetical protein [Variovorax sp. J22P271]
MTSPLPPLWYRHAWWAPAIASAVAIPMAAAALRPSEQSIWLVVAVLCALPWSLALLVLDLSAGFADRAALVVCVGLLANLLLLWGLTARMRARFCARQGAAGPTPRR